MAWRYNPRAFEEAMRNYDAVIASNGRHPLYQDLVRGANQYWTDLGFAKRGANGQPGFFDKSAAQDYIRRKFGENGYTMSKNRGLARSTATNVTAERQAQIAQNNVAQQAINSDRAAAFQASEQAKAASQAQRRADVFARKGMVDPRAPSTTTSSTASPAGATAVTQAAAGQQGASTNTTQPPTTQETVNSQVQTASQKNNTNGNTQRGRGITDYYDPKTGRKK